MRTSKPVQRDTEYNVKMEPLAYFLVSRSCEFLHTNALGEEIKTSEVDILKKLISANGEKIYVLEEKLLNLERVLNESAQNVNVLETKLCKKIEVLEVKVAALVLAICRDAR